MTLNGFTRFERMLDKIVPVLLLSLGGSTALAIVNLAS